MSEPIDLADPLDAARDRLADRVITEALGSESPPDLSSSILERNEAMQAESTVKHATRSDTATRWLVGIGSVAALLLVSFALVLPGTQSSREAAVRESDDERAIESKLKTAAQYKSFSGSVQREGASAEEAAGLLDVLSRRADASTSPPLPNDGLSTGVESKAPSFDTPLAPELTVIDESLVPTAPQEPALGVRFRPQGVVDVAELRDSERRLGASTIFNTNPAQGQVPRFDIRPSDATSERFAAGQSMSSNQRDHPEAPAPQIRGMRELVRSRSELGEGTRSQAVSSPTIDHDFFAYNDAAPGAEAKGSQHLDKLYWQRMKERASIASKVSVASRVRDEDLRWFHPVDLGRREAPSRDRYEPIHENPFITPDGSAALSTFSIDVDTASYSNVRQYLLDSRRLPPPAAVRVEELINYFDYGYAGPEAGREDPFAASMEVGYCPWKPEHRLVRIGIQGRRIDADKRPLSNLVFLVDVSGSMNSPNKLPLVIAGLQALTDRLGENDRVAIVVYAGSEGVVLPSTSGEAKDEIRSALGRLQAGGSTAGGAGLKLAYEIAERNKVPGGVNRVVLCTDGDFNVGLTGTEDLAQLVESRGKEQGVFLTVLGFGRGNLNDAMLEAISGRGDGHYAYIDNEKEARRVLSRDLAGTLVTIAKDVKIQVEFNPAKVASYRLIGYENRVMAAKDFNDDTKDAGEIGAGHTVTALYEVVPVGVAKPAPPVDGLKYQQADGSGQTAEGPDSGASAPGEIDEPTEFSGEMLTLKIRYKQPEGGASKKLEFPLDDPGDSLRQETIDFRWASAVAEFGMVLRGSRHVGDADFDDVLELARPALGDDPQGYRAEMLDLVRRARDLRRGE